MLHEKVDERPSHSTDSTVLIADDDALMREIARSLLSSAGYRTIVAESGREALELCQEQTVSLALLDVSMPDGDGLETCAKLRKLPGWAETPIVMLTAFKSKTVMDAAAAVGASGFIIKPFIPLVLLQRVGALTGRTL